MSCQSATHGKRLVHTYQSLDPRIDQEVVANTYLHGSGVACLDKHDVEEGRVEYNVTMVGHEGIALVKLPIG